LLSFLLPGLFHHQNREMMLLHSNPGSAGNTIWI
jgi:hypothetical protein